MFSFHPTTFDRHKFTLAILLLATALPAHAVSLCTAREQVVLSCPIGYRIVSLCASRGISPTRAHLRYVSGRQGHFEKQLSTTDTTGCAAV